MKSWIILLTLSLALLGHGDEVRRRQEEISRAFYQRLGQLTTRAEHQQSESRAGSGRNYGGFAPWQSAFSAANDAFKVFQRYETLRNIPGEKPVSITNGRPRAFADDQKKKNQFIAFEAVPNVLTSDSEEDLPVRIELIKDEPIIEYIPFDSNVLKNSQPSTQFDLNLSTSVAIKTPLIATTTATSTTTSSTTSTTSTPTTSTTTTSTNTTPTTSTTTTSIYTTTGAASTTSSFPTTTATIISTITRTTTSTTSSTITAFTPSTVINDHKLNELIDEIFVPYDPNLKELLDEIFVITTTSTNTTTTSPTVISTTSIHTTTSTTKQEKTTTEKPKTLVDLILTNVFKLTSDVDPSSQTANLWELAEKYVPTSTISSNNTSTSLLTTTSSTTITTTLRLSTTNIIRTTTTSTTSTPATRKDHSTSRNQNANEQIESRGFPVKVVIDPHGLEFYFPDVLNLLFGFV